MNVKIQISAERYFELRDGCSPYSSFSDPDGTVPYGYGVPAMDTDWGKDELTVCRCEMRKSDRHQKDWEYIFYEYTPPFNQSED